MNGWDASLSKIEADLNSGSLDHNERNARRLTLVGLARDAGQEATRFGQQQSEAKRLLDALGPAPKEGERAKLESEFVALSALRGRSDLIVAKANLLLRQLDEVRIKAFAQELFERGNSLLRSATWQSVPNSLKSLEASIGSLILLSLLPARLWQRAEREGSSQPERDEASTDEEGTGGWSITRLGEARWLRLVSLLCALIVLIAAILGYVMLSDYVALFFMTVVSVGFILLVLRRALREGLHAYLFRKQRTYGGWIRLFIKSERGANFLELFIFIILDVILALIAPFIILPSAGMAEDELQVWLYTNLQGFSIAGMNIKPFNIMLAILVFLFILGFTHFVQRRLRRCVLSNISPENSVQQSITTGIGFGLQNIVSNFVSGLILLIERPIKVGDWVVVGANEGVVKRISVRAAEVETWQRSSVLIPNSDLVSTTVTNWTHKDKLGRIDIPVRVPFGNDPQKVHDLLLEAAPTATGSWPHWRPTSIARPFRRTAWSSTSGSMCTTSTNR